MTHLSCYRKAKQWLNAFASCQDPLANEQPISLDKKSCAEITAILTIALPKLEEMCHTSSNKRIKQGLKPHAKRTS